MNRPQQRQTPTQSGVTIAAAIFELFGNIFCNALLTNNIKNSMTYNTKAKRQVNDFP
jgi:hypothetical protein